MKMRERFTGLMFHIDTNRINARQKLENMNRLEEWKKSGDIYLEMSERTLEEASAGSEFRRKKALESSWSMTYADTQEEIDILSKIEQILFPDGAGNDNQNNDVEIVFNAKKYCRILITNDGGSNAQPGGILGNAGRLKSELGIEVITDTDAVLLVTNRIESRNAHCRLIADRTGEPLPDWVSKA